MFVFVNKDQRCQRWDECSDGTDGKARKNLDRVYSVQQPKWNREYERQYEKYKNRFGFALHENSLQIIIYVR